MTKLYKYFGLQSKQWNTSWFDNKKHKMFIDTLSHFLYFPVHCLSPAITYLRIEGSCIPIRNLSYRDFKINNKTYIQDLALSTYDQDMENPNSIWSFHNFISGVVCEKLNKS